jgi:hypothetical protein
MMGAHLGPPGTRDVIGAMGGSWGTVPLKPVRSDPRDRA